MLAVERIRKIKEVLLDCKHVEIDTLCSLLSVSVATVRRDLDKLEETGFLIKTHGGAILNEYDEDVQNRNYDDPYLNSKIQIANIASEMIDNDSIIFLGSGSTCLQVAKKIKDKDNITIVTNNINIVIELAYNKKSNIILLGGDVNVFGSNIGVEGQYTLSNLENMFIKKSFVTVDGINIDNGYTVNSREQARLLNLLSKQSNEMIVVADSSKFGKRAFTHVSNITDYSTIITNVDVSDIYKEFYFDHGIRIFTSFDDIRNY
jgi:DeoR family fructose operon transcriptional repressor